MTGVNPGVVVCLALGLVVGINGLMIIALTRGGVRRQIELMRRATQTAHRPFRKEDDALEELHRRVSNLSVDPLDEPSQPDAPKSAGSF